MFCKLSRSGTYCLAKAKNHQLQGSQSEIRARFRGLKLTRFEIQYDAVIINIFF